jgi:hypothetical protein
MWSFIPTIVMCKNSNISSLFSYPRLYSSYISSVGRNSLLFNETEVVDVAIVFLLYVWIVL